MRQVLGEAEVGQHRGVVFAQDDVAGLDVAVDDTGRVGLMHGAGDGLDDAGGFIGVHGSAFDHAVGVLAFQELHGEEWVSFDLSGLVDAHDIGVADAGDVFDLALEARDGVAVHGVAGGKQLECDGALQVGLPSAVDAGLSAAGQFFLDQETPHLLPQLGQRRDVKA
ncbi:MAG: hypothetical protein M5U25_12820 [Planctomycetota bacterium]|nr:hypothetical protein [Planctomycetota bacterium]